MQKLAQLTLLSVRNNNFICVRYVRKRVNKRIDPGISYMNNLFNEKQLDQLDSTNYEDLEADFQNLDMSHKEHIHEIEGMKEKEKYHIVKQKYFKEKYPNFLTWADKQQIKNLHDKDPNKWTIDRLSEGFPAIPEVIQKIIKSNWTKKNAKKIESHDAVVVENWSQFKEGKLEVPLFLAEHLNKFTDRKLNFNPIDQSDQSYVKSTEISLPRGEFSHIITSYQSLVSPKQIEEKVKPIEKHLKKLTYITENPEEFDVKESLTFKEYKNQLRNQNENSFDLSETNKSILSSDVVVNEGKKEIEVKVAKYVDYKGNVSLYSKNKHDYSHLKYPEKIMIPQKIRKRGFTYKLCDCYYDYDGEFLYRIPGMD